MSIICLPASITIGNMNDSFGNEYAGIYFLSSDASTEGEYYVREDGKFRFKAVLGASTEVVSSLSAYESQFEKYGYATEMEQRCGNSFYGRDDYLFATGNTILDLKKLGTKFSTLDSGDAEWATITLGGTQTDEYENYPKVVTVQYREDFDIKSYFSEYHLMTTGRNAGYYVSDDGKNRFSANFVDSAFLSSHSYYGDYIDTYSFVSELETLYGDSYCKRDDFVFSTVQNFSLAADDSSARFVLGTKFTVREGEDPSWAKVTFENESEEESSGDGTSFPKCIVISDATGCFDCREYIGNYIFQVSGENAGYYVKEDGSQRFLAKMSSVLEDGEAWSVTQQQTGFVSQMETLCGNSYYGRGDFVYGSSSVIGEAEKVITGWSGYEYGADVKASEYCVQYDEDEQPSYDGTGLPVNIEVKQTANFDCSCYFGTYTLNTIGSNAGYYVKEDGSQRFSASPVKASDICSSSYDELCSEYVYAVEMESCHGNGFYGRDDYLFCTEASIDKAVFLSSKYSAHTGNYAAVSFSQENLESEDSIQTEDKKVDAPDLDSLPEVISITDVDGFDCKGYLGTYTLFTYGSNKGYYVHESGTHRFSATASESVSICSSAYSDFCQQYQYAFEMESGYNGSFSRRDDFIFTDTESLQDALQDKTALLGTKFTIHEGEAPDWAVVSAVIEESAPEDLPQVLTISDVEGFDCKEYIGSYVLETSGSNAGYYVKSDGSQRFLATVSVRNSICSSTYLATDNQYAYATELESLWGDQFYKRDDFIFCTSDSIASAVYAGTKFTIHNDNSFDWASITISDEVPEEMPVAEGEDNTLDGLLIYPFFSSNDIILIRYSFDEGKTWRDYEPGSGISHVAEKNITFRIYDKNDSYKESTFVLQQDESVVSNLKWQSADSEKYTLEISMDNFENVLRTNISGIEVNNFALPDMYQWRISDSNGIGISIKASEDELEVTTDQFIQVGDNSDSMSFLWCNVGECWDGMYCAFHSGMFDEQGIFHEGIGELAVLDGKNKITGIFDGGSGVAILNMTDSENGDALFSEDIFSSSYEDRGLTYSRLKDLNEIYAGAGDDVVDMTSSCFMYTGENLRIHGGDGDDIIWANSCPNVLFGDCGNDAIVGGIGNDVIAGGEGDDAINGCGGDDIVCFGENWGNDTVTQQKGGKLTLWFADEIDFGSNFSISSDRKTLSYQQNSITLLDGLTFDDVSLIHGDVEFGTEVTYGELEELGAFAEYTSRNVFEDRTTPVI